MRRCAVHGTITDANNFASGPQGRRGGRRRTSKPRIPSALILAQRRPQAPDKPSPISLHCVHRGHCRYTPRRKRAGRPAIRLISLPICRLLSDRCLILFARRKLPVGLGRLVNAKGTPSPERQLLGRPPTASRIVQVVSPPLHT